MRSVRARTSRQQMTAWHSANSQNHPMARAILAHFLRVLAMIVVLPSLANAETHVTGNVGALTVEAVDSNIREVLAGLSASLGVRYRLSADLNKLVRGTYRGALGSVITQLLDGYDFWVRYSGDTIEIVVVGASHGAMPKPPATGATAVNVRPKLSTSRDR